MKSFKLYLIAAATVMLAACASDTDPLQLPPPEPPVYEPEKPIVFKQADVSQDGMEIVIDKRVDVLFVIDDSRSMQHHQTNLAKNINRFVDTLSAKKLDIDFHIAVTTVNDRKRYLPDDSVVPRICRENGKEELMWEDPGTLKALTLEGKKLDRPERYIMQGKGYLEVLRSTLNVGAQEFEENTTMEDGKVIKCARGPLDEDLFTPLIAVVTNPPKANEGFRREGALLVAILVTDAMDASGLNAGQVYKILQQATGDRISGKRKLRVFAVAMNKGDDIDAQGRLVIPGSDSRPKCSPDPAFGWTRSQAKPVTIPDHSVIELARLTGDSKADGESQILSICRNYGDTLANFGEKIVRDVIHDEYVQIPYLPNMLKNRPTVTIGETPLEEHKEWNYNEQTNEVVIYSSQVDWSKFEGQQVKVHYEPVDPQAETTKPKN